jgi:nitrous oxidase accessory protein NosD
LTNGKTNRIILLLGFLLLLVATISASTAADTIYVDNATGSDGNDGLTPTTAKATIQNGTDTVDPEGTVYVADGTYNEQVVINKNLNLIGQSQSGTIISGTNTGRPVTINQATVTLTSFTIQDGNNVQHVW